MKKYEFLRGWNKGGTVEFAADGTSTLRDKDGIAYSNFRQIDMEEVDNWLRINFCKEV